MTVWKCVSCGKELPSSRRSDMRYCRVRCRVQAHRIRKGEGQHVRPTKKHGHTALKVALGTVAAATAAAAAIELVREGQDARLEEQQRKIADQQEQLLKSQTEKEELRRELEDLRNRVDQVTKEKEAQLLQKGKELDAEKETVKALRSSLEITRKEREQAEQGLLVEEMLRENMENTYTWLTERLKGLLSNTSDRVDDLTLRNEKLSRQLAEAKDKREVQLAKIAASKSHQQVKARLESAQLAIWSLTQQLRAAETSRSSSPKMLPAKAPMKQLPAVQKTLPASSAQTALAVANQRIKELTSNNQRLEKEKMEAQASAGRWEWNYRQLAAQPPAVNVVADESRQIARHSEVQEELASDEPGFVKRAFVAIGMVGAGVVIGAGAASMLGSSPDSRVLGPAKGQKALAPRKQLLLPPKSDS